MYHPAFWRIISDTVSEATVSLVGTTKKTAKTSPTAGQPGQKKAGEKATGSDVIDWSSIELCTEMVLDDPKKSVRKARQELASNMPFGIAKLEPIEAAASIDRKWAPGRTLRVRYLDGDPAIHARITKIAEEWERHININLVFDNSANAEIRISLTRGGSWSYVGTDCLGIAKSRATMQFGWLTTGSSEFEYRRVVLHEFGHALGLQHEQQSPAAGIPWDKTKVYEYYARTQNPPWDKAKVDHNVIAPLDKNRTNYSAFDRDSIMQYAVPASMTIGGYTIAANEELSATDREFMAKWYPYARQNLGVAKSALVSRHSATVDALWISPSGSVMRSTWTGNDAAQTSGAWSAPSMVSPAGSARPGAIVAVARTSNHLDAFWVAPNGAVMTASWVQGGAWSVPTAIAGAAADHGALAAVARSSYQIDVAWVAASGAVLTSAWRSGGAWTAPSEIANVDSAEPGSICLVSKATHLLSACWITQNYEVATSSWREGVGWSPATLISGAERAEAGSLGAVARLSNHLDVAWIRADGALLTASSHDGGSAPLVWSKPAVIAPANTSIVPGAALLASPLDDMVQALLVAPDGGLVAAEWRDGKAWGAPGRISAAGAAEQRSISVTHRLSDRSDVVSVGRNGAVSHLGRAGTAAWEPATVIAPADSAQV